jgi:GT2 family glycosyltransferase
LRFTIVIPSVEAVRSALTECVPSFLEHHGAGHEVILVDDGSDPGTRVRAARLSAEQGLRFLHSSINRGFAATANRGLRAASGDIVVLVNSDVRFVRPVLGPMAAAFGLSPRIGLVGGLLEYPWGGVQHGGIVRGGSYFAHRGAGQPAGDEVCRSGYVLGCTGALLGLRREMIERVGLFD